MAHDPLQLDLEAMSRDPLESNAIPKPIPSIFSSTLPILKMVSTRIVNAN